MDQTDILAVLVLVLVFGAIVLVVLALAPFIRQLDFKNRLASQNVGAVQVQAEADNLLSGKRATVWAKLVHEVEKRGLSLTDDTSEKMETSLALAGFDQPYAPRVFTLIRSVLAMIMPIVVTFTLGIFGVEFQGFKFYIMLFGSAFAGLYLPGIIISSIAKNRRELILNGFPDTLDLMLVCLEAGLGLDATFNRVGVEITRSHPELAKLFAKVSLELRAGRNRDTALRQLARRSGVEEISAFTALIIQSDKLGSSVAQALRIYATEMREARKMRAEEKAHRIPVLLSIPLILFLLPTMIGVIMLPNVININNQFSEDQTRRR